jgi:hypothetical protein
MFKAVGGHVSPPPGITPPVRWGDPEFVQELLGAQADVVCTPRMFTWRFASAEDFFETFKAFYGPTVKVWEALDEAGRQSLRDALVGLAETHNRSTGSGVVFDAEYLEVVATKR